jgi:hypothetical protein
MFTWYEITILFVHPPFNFWMSEPIFMKLDNFIMAPELISTAYFINPFYQSVCQYVYPPIVARQRLGKNVTAATDTHTKIEEFWDASFYAAHSRKTGICYFPQFLVYASFFNDAVNVESMGLLYWRKYVFLVLLRAFCFSKQFSTFLEGTFLSLILLRIPQSV